jgi:hypothetical protein
VVQQLQYPAHLPRTAQTDPTSYPGGGKIPEQEFAEFPKVIVVKCDEAYRNAWLARNEGIDPQTHKKSYPGCQPQIGGFVSVLDEQGQPIIVNSKDEEIAVRAKLGIGPPPRLARVVEVELDETVRVEQEAIQKKLHDENAALKAQLDEIMKQVEALKNSRMQDNPHRAHKGWPKGVKRGPRKLPPVRFPPRAERVEG